MDYLWQRGHPSRREHREADAPFPGYYAQRRVARQRQGGAGRWAAGEPADHDHALEILAPAENEASYADMYVAAIRAMMNCLRCHVDEARDMTNSVSNYAATMSEEGADNYAVNEVVYDHMRNVIRKLADAVQAPGCMYTWKQRVQDWRATHPRQDGYGLDATTYMRERSMRR